MSVNLCEWIQGVTPDMLPSPPIRTRPDSFILDVGFWLEILRREAKTTPDSPETLRRLADIYNLVEGYYQW